MATETTEAPKKTAKELTREKLLADARFKVMPTSSTGQGAYNGIPGLRHDLFQYEWAHIERFYNVNQPWVKLMVKDEFHPGVSPHSFTTDPNHLGCVMRNDSFLIYTTHEAYQELMGTALRGSVERADAIAKQTGAKDQSGKQAENALDELMQQERDRRAVQARTFPNNPPLPPL